MKTLFFFIFLFNAISVIAQSETELINKAAQQEKAMNDQAAYATLQEVIQINPNNYHALWKLSELSSVLGSYQKNPKQKEQFFLTGRKYALNAIKANPSGADGYYALAVATGRLVKTQSVKEKVHSAKQIRTNAEKAIKLNPRHARAWYVMGKWHYEISDLGMFEKAAMKVAFGGMPDASLEESIKAHEKAKSLDPSFSLNYLSLAKAYHRAGKKAKAIESLTTLQQMPDRSSEDPRIKASAAKLLSDWR